MAWSTTWQTNWFRDIATASIGPRSVVATGPGELEACQWEVEPDTERFIQIAEVRRIRGHQVIERTESGQKIVSPYQWTTYNILVLPPSFPCQSIVSSSGLLGVRLMSIIDGGMENPQYTFATPTLITGVSEMSYNHWYPSAIPTCAMFPSCTCPRANISSGLDSYSYFRRAPNVSPDFPTQHFNFIRERSENDYGHFHSSHMLSFISRDVIPSFLDQA